jgi:hypothetical protein
MFDRVLSQRFHNLSNVYFGVVVVALRDEIGKREKIISLEHLPERTLLVSTGRRGGGGGGRRSRVNDRRR